MTMRSFSFFFIFNLIIIVTSSAVSITTSSDSHTSTKHLSKTHPTFITHLPKFQSTHVPLPRPQIITSTFHTRSIPPIIPIQTRIPSSHSSGQKPVSVVFEVIGGLLASGLLLGFVRCCYHYKKAPRRDRIAEILNRHNLQRELEEIERNPQTLHRSSLREPAPPYVPAPPPYDVINSSHADTRTRNLPSSPPPQPSVPPPAG